MVSERKMIALRLDESTYAAVEALAKQELRPMANMVDILVRAGLRDVKARVSRPDFSKPAPPCPDCGSTDWGHATPCRKTRRSPGGGRQMDLTEAIARQVKAGPVRRPK